MKLIRTSEILNSVRGNAPVMWQSLHTAVFSREFIENEWDTFWKALKNSPDGHGGKLVEYPMGSQACEEFVHTAIAWFKKSVRLALGGIDATAGAFEVRLSIPAGLTFNGVPGPAGHSTVLLAVKSKTEPTDIPSGIGEVLQSGVAGEPSYVVTTGGFQLMLWEPQNEQWQSIEDADEKGIEISDIIL